MKIPKKCPKFGISPSPNPPNFRELKKKGVGGGGGWCGGGTQKGLIHLQTHSDPFPLPKKKKKKSKHEKV